MAIQIALISQRAKREVRQKEKKPVEVLLAQQQIIASGGVGGSYRGKGQRRYKN